MDEIELEEFKNRICHMISGINYEANVIKKRLNSALKFINKASSKEEIYEYFEKNDPEEGFEFLSVTLDQ